MLSEAQPEDYTHYQYKGKVVYNDAYYYFVPRN